MREHWKHGRILGVAMAAWTIASAASAQVTPPLLSTVHERAATIDGACISGATVRITVKADGKDIRLGDTNCVKSAFSVDVKAVPLRDSYQIVALQDVGGTVSAAVTMDVEAFAGPFGDERGAFESNGYIGLAIDTFGSDELNRYLNPEANGQIHERSIFGIDFGYRLFKRGNGSPQIWVYGETLHGVRSEDIDCEKSPNLPSCKKALSEFAGNIPENALFLLRNATSLEAYVGVRVEFWRMNFPGDAPATVYINMQPGFLEVAGSDGDAKAAHHIGIGALVTGGAMQGSYLEFGRGWSELFATNRKRRYIIDGMLVRKLGDTGLGLFAQLYADVDLKDGSDSIQSYFGLNYDVSKLFGGAN
jgi:hypothetical protein